MDDSNNSCAHCITDLPDEMLGHIFSFLPINDLLNACCVCKHWLRIIERIKEFKRVCPHIEGDQYPEHFTRNFTYFKFSLLTSYEFLTHILATKGDIILALDFEDCINNYEGPKIDLPVLESLKVVESIHVWKLIGSIPRLKRLELQDSNDKEFSMIGDTPRLEHFLISGHLQPRIAVKRFYSGADGYKKNPSEAILSVEAFKAFLGFRAKCLKILDMTKLLFLFSLRSDETKLLDIGHLRLSTLRANSINVYPDILVSQTAITNLHLRISLQSSANDILTNICRHLTNLEVLDVEGELYLSRSTLYHIFKLKHLKRLCLYKCINAELIGALEDHDKSTRFALTHFFIALLECDVAVAMTLISKMATNLKFISVLCYNKLSDFHAIRAEFDKTRELYFS